MGYQTVKDEENHSSILNDSERNETNYSVSNSKRIFNYAIVFVSFIGFSCIIGNSSNSEKNSILLASGNSNNNDDDMNTHKILYYRKNYQKEMLI